MNRERVLRDVMRWNRRRVFPKAEPMAPPPARRDCPECGAILYGDFHHEHLDGRGPSKDPRKVMEEIAEDIGFELSDKDTGWRYREEVRKFCTCDARGVAGPMPTDPGAHAKECRFAVYGKDPADIIEPGWRDPRTAHLTTPSLTKAMQNQKQCEDEGGWEKLISAAARVGLYIRRRGGSLYLYPFGGGAHRVSTLMIEKTIEGIANLEDQAAAAPVEQLATRPPMRAVDAADVLGDPEIVARLGYKLRSPQPITGEVRKLRAGQELADSLGERRGVDWRERMRLFYAPPLWPAPENQLAQLIVDLRRAGVDVQAAIVEAGPELLRLR